MLVLSRHFSRTGLKPEVKRTELPFEVEGATIVLVDVLYTVAARAAINELFDFAPGRIELAVLVDRGGPSCRSSRLTPARASSSRANFVVLFVPMTASCAFDRGGRCVTPARSGRKLFCSPSRLLPSHRPHPRYRGAFASIAERDVKKVPLLHAGRCSTCSSEIRRAPDDFEIAAKRLSTDVINLNIASRRRARARRCSTPSTASSR